MKLNISLMKLALPFILVMMYWTSFQCNLKFESSDAAALQTASGSSDIFVVNASFES